MSDAPWPTELRIDRARACLDIDFDDGTSFSLPNELLRVCSPSAEVQGHGGKRPPPPSGKSGVAILAAHPVGRYAVRLVFDDGHETGIFTWPYLRDLGETRPERQRDYEARLAEAGGHR